MSNEPYMPIIEKYRPQIQKMRLFDDDFMRVAFDNHIEGTETVLQIIMGKSDLKVQSVAAQREFKNIYGRSVRLDVYATDAAGKVYNIEVQRADKGAGKKRARYNQSIIDASHMPAGEDPECLPEVYVIFFAEHDVLGKGIPIYHIDRTVAETGELFDDGEHIIYVNGAYEKEDTALGALIADFRESDPSKVRHESLARRMRYLKESEEGVSHMCKIMEEIVKKETLEASIKSFIEGLVAAGLLGFDALVSKVIEKFSLTKPDAEAAVRRYGA